VAINPADGKSFRIPDGATVEVRSPNSISLVMLKRDPSVPQGTLLVPRSLGVPINGPVPVDLRQVERVPA
jgi:anaerobic selenocysteine-containing dehydrogenase